MKKKYAFLILFLILLFPKNVKAAAISINCSSSSVTVGDTFSCSILGINSMISAVKGSISYSSNISVTNYSKIKCSNGEVLASSFDCIDEQSNNSLSVATYTFKANSAGTATITVSNGEIVDGSFNVNKVGVASKSVTVNNKQTTVTPAPNTNTTTNTTTNNTTKVETKDTSLKSVSIEGVNFDFKSGIHDYNLKVNTTVNSLKFNYAVNDKSATAKLSGPDTLSDGDNTYKIVVTNGSSSTTYKFVVNKAAEYIETSYDENKIVSLLTDGMDSKIIVNLKDIEYKVISKNVLKLLKDNKRTAIYKVYESDKLLYSIKINGEDIENYDSYLDINMQLNSKIIDIKDTYYNFNLSQKNEFKGKILLTITNDLLTNKGYLYKINGSNYDYVKDVPVNKEIEIEINEFANYILTSKEITTSEVIAVDDKKYNPIIILLIGLGVLVVGNIAFIYIFIKRNKKKVTVEEPKNVTIDIVKQEPSVPVEEPSVPVEEPKVKDNKVIEILDDEIK